MTREEILSLFNYRHACKEFDKTKIISDEDFNLILEVARLSPSSFGFEPWKFLLIQNPSLRDRLKLGSWGVTVKLDTASHFIICLCRKNDMHYDSRYVYRMMHDIQLLSDSMLCMKKEFYQEFQEVDFDLTDDRKLFDWSARQCYIALGNMLTVAAMLNIDSCPLEGFNIAQTNSILEKEFNININEFSVVYMVAFGYRIVQPSPKTRKELNEIVQIF